VLPAILAFAETALATDPPRRTHALREPLTGMRSGNVGSYRVLVEVDPVDMMVWVVRAAYHADVYRGR
jgi:mRNA-degrading endonuclease RelE of RelBE toxin-antitoxin system